MARNDRPNEEQTANSEVQTDAAAATVTDGAAAAVAEAKSDDRFKVLAVLNPSTQQTEQIKRADFIRALWKGENVAGLNPEGKKHSRSEITKLVNAYSPKKVLYQIIFAATKNIPGGPPKAEAAPAGEVAAAGSEAPANT
jgi:hypothetical protein